jgi:hypothetical protein
MFIVILNLNRKLQLVKLSTFVNPHLKIIRPDSDDIYSLHRRAENERVPHVGGLFTSDRVC